MTAIRDTSLESLAEQGVSGQAAQEIHAFGRFLDEVGKPERKNLLRALGWRPYVLGVGPWPDEGMAEVPVTAWTFPA